MSRKSGYIVTHYACNEENNASCKTFSRSIGFVLSLVFPTSDVYLAFDLSIGQ
jgi:hypothetical protein